MFTIYRYRRAFPRDILTVKLDVEELEIFLAKFDGLMVGTIMRARVMRARSIEIDQQ